MTLEELNALPARNATDAFRACCGAERWVAAMTAGRPYASLETLLDAADAAWATTGPEDWEEAFAHHPRIGERKAQAGVSDRAAAWSSGEQAKVAEGEAGTRKALAEGNAAYEQKFGRIFLICATGLTAEEMLDQLLARLANDPEAELAVAAAEQHRITRLRLHKLLTSEAA